MFLIFFYICCTTAQYLNNTEVSFVYITNGQNFEEVFNNLQTENSDINLTLTSIKAPKKLEFLQKSLICDSNPSIIFDLTSNEIRHLNSKSIDIPYIKAPFLKSFFEPVRRFIVETGKFDAVVFIDTFNETPADIFDGNSVSPLRVIVSPYSKNGSFAVQWIPNNTKAPLLVIIASTNKMNEIFKGVSITI